MPDVISHYEFKRKGAVVPDGNRIGEQRGVGDLDEMGQVKALGVP